MLSFLNNLRKYRQERMLFKKQKQDMQSVSWRDISKRLGRSAECSAEAGMLLRRVLDGVREGDAELDHGEENLCVCTKCLLRAAISSLDCMLLELKVSDLSGCTF